jgi:hypothetical protein
MGQTAGHPNAACGEARARQEMLQETRPVSRFFFFFERPANPLPRTLPIDGSQDNELDIKGLPDVEIGPWWEAVSETDELAEVADDGDDSVEFVGDNERG